MNVDTLSIARDLKASELPAAQAEAIAAAIGRAVVESSATKADLHLMGAGLDAKIQQVSGQLEGKLEQVRTEIERSRNQIIVGFISTQIAIAGLVIAAVKLF